MCAASSRARRRGRADVERTALIVVDVQQGFEDPTWGERNNPACEENIAALIEAWRAVGQPIVYVRHDSTEAGSPFTPGEAGNDFQDILTGEPDLLVTKRVNSSFHGEPDLAEWLRGEGIRRVAVCGIQTNMCCETTARVAANLAFDTTFVLDATYTFDLPAHGGGSISADELARVTASNLDPEFGRVVDTQEAVAGLRAAATPASR
jgi:nicotinamidase-related amidase